MPKQTHWEHKDLYIDESCIVGSGVYCEEDLNAGDIVIKWGNASATVAEFRELIKEFPILLKQAKYIDGRWHWIEDFRCGDIMNHDCDPNCEIKGRNIVATKYIQADVDEITVDYESCPEVILSKEDLIAHVFTCVCGNDNCRGEIGNGA